MQFFRRIVFYLFAAIYIIICPLLLLYAYGYIYKPGTEQGLLTTGLIYVATAPTGSEIYVNDKKYASNTPTAIMELLPGEYSIKLELDGYKPWSQTVPVEKEKATVLDKLLLVPLERKVTEVANGSITEIIPVGKSGFLITRSGSTLGEMKVYGYRDEKTWTLLPEESSFKDAEFVSLFSEEESSYVLIRASVEKTGKFFWIKLAEGGNTVKDISDLFLKEPDEISWDAGAEDSLFFMHDGSLDKIAVGEGAVYPELIRSARGYGLFDGEIYLLNESGTIIKTGYDAKTSTTILDDPHLGKQIFGSSGSFQVKVLSSDIIIFIGSGGELIANHLPYKFVDEGTRGIQFYQEKNKVLIWKKDRIGILDFATEETQNTSFEKGPSMRWVYTEGKDIRNAFWVYEDSHVLFQDGASVYLLALEEFGAVTLDEIIKAGKRSDIYYSEDTGLLYFLESRGRGLFETRIVPEKKLIPVSLPAGGSDTEDLVVTSQDASRAKNK